MRTLLAEHAARLQLFATALEHYSAKDDFPAENFDLKWSIMYFYLLIDMGWDVKSYSEGKYGVPVLEQEDKARRMLEIFMRTETPQ